MGELPTMKPSEYVKYLHVSSEQFIYRFHPWPKWLIPSDESFNFESNKIDLEKREISFEKFMDFPSDPSPLLDIEKK